MDITNVATISAMTLAITEAIKQIFNVPGKWNKAIAVLTGSILMGLFYGLNNNLFPVAAIPYINLILYGLGGGLSAIGLYDFTTKEFARLK